MNPEKVAELIRAGLPGAQVLVQSPDNTHYSARIVAQAFAGKRGIARHQLVYATLGELVGREIHALSIEAFTPDAASRTFIHDTIYNELCRGIIEAKSREHFLAIIAEGARRGADCVILGCTEIVMLIDPKTAGLPGYDTTAIHCAALVDFATGDRA